MLRTFLGIPKTINYLLIILLFIFLSYSFNDNFSYAGVAIPPKDLMYKHDPEYKSPDLDPEDPAAKKELPPKIYYYKKGAISEYYRNSGKYISPSKNPQEKTYNNTSATQYNYSQDDNLQSASTTKKNNLLIIVITLSIIALILVLSSILLTINRKQQEAKTVPVYEKYSTKPLRKKRETIFDKVK